MTEYQTSACTREYRKAVSLHAALELIVCLDGWLYCRGCVIDHQNPTSESVTGYVGNPYGKNNTMGKQVCSMCSK